MFPNGPKLTAITFCDRKETSLRAMPMATIERNIWLQCCFQEWDDINLAWNKSEYDDIVDIRLPPKYIWKPDLLMYNR